MSLGNIAGFMNELATGQSREQEHQPETEGITDPIPFEPSHMRPRDPPLPAGAAPLLRPPGPRAPIRSRPTQRWQPRRPPGPTHFASLPLGHHHELQDRASAFTRSLFAYDPPIKGLDRTIVIPPRRLHFTLGVMNLWDDVSGKGKRQGVKTFRASEGGFDGVGAREHPGELRRDGQTVARKTVSEALELLQKTSKEARALLGGQRLMTSLDKLGNFDKNRENSHVLYAEPSRPSSVLEIGELFATRFREAGFITDTRDLKLHCTLLNVTKRKRSGNNDDDSIASSDNRAPYGSNAIEGNVEMPQTNNNDDVRSNHDDGDGDHTKTGGNTNDEARKNSGNHGNKRPQHRNSNSRFTKPIPFDASSIFRNFHPPQNSQASSLPLPSSSLTRADREELDLLSSSLKSSPLVQSKPSQTSSDIVPSSPGGSSVHPLDPGAIVASSSLPLSGDGELQPQRFDLGIYPLDVVQLCEMGSWDWDDGGGYMSVGEERLWEG